MCVFVGYIWKAIYKVMSSLVIHNEWRVLETTWRILVSKADIHADFFKIVVRKGKGFAFVVPVDRGQVRGGNWWIALRENLGSGSYLVKGSLVTEVTESDVTMDIKVLETSDGWRVSDWIVLQGGLRRTYGLEMISR
jgi:hypothetical protein